MIRAAGVGRFSNAPNRKSYKKQNYIPVGNQLPGEPCAMKPSRLFLATTLGLLTMWLRASVPPYCLAAKDNPLVIWMNRCAKKGKRPMDRSSI